MGNKPLRGCNGCAYRGFALDTPGSFDTLYECKYTKKNVWWYDAQQRKVEGCARQFTPQDESGAWIIEEPKPTDISYPIEPIFDSRPVEPLKPCPQCGNEPRLDVFIEVYAICMRCGRRTIKCKTKKEAVERWNNNLVRTTNEV